MYHPVGGKSSGIEEIWNAHTLASWNWFELEDNWMHSHAYQDLPNNSLSLKHDSAFYKFIGKIKGGNVRVEYHRLKKFSG